ncbi:MAG: hypothetical protein V4667_05840 [Bacteroidota bacterium]
MNYKNNWIKSKGFDLAFILLPPFVCLLLIVIFPSFFETHESNQLVWFVLVLCIDVGHVYTTIYRTYLDKETLNKNKLLFYFSPIVLYIVGVVLHSTDSIFFWRCITYLAVFHFIRQQYGFMRLYARNDVSKLSRIIDTITIYSATIYPILYWHLNGKLDFNWFVENDFFYLDKPVLIPFFFLIFVTVLILYFAKEFFFSIKNKEFNLAKNLIIIGTIVSWYFGIVYFKGDLTFTFLNVVSHGIPYYALVWAYGNKSKIIESKQTLLSKLFKVKYILLFIALVLLLAYFEEMLWDGLVWKEHFSIFPTTYFLPDLSNNSDVLSLLIPLLSMPQILHYFIDGFIWKVKNDKFGWSTFLIKK